MAFKALGVAMMSCVCAFEVDIISDITSPVADEGRSLDIKAEQFWRPVLDAAQATKNERHGAVYKEVEEVIDSLPSDNHHVRDLLTQALSLLRRADETASRQAEVSLETAADHIAAGPSVSAYSFMAGGQSFVSLALRRFFGGGDSDRVTKHVEERQADIFPALRGTAKASSGVLKDCRTAAQYCFEALKYDIYKTDAARTPPAAKAAARKIIKASQSTQRQFTKSIAGTADVLAKDTQEKYADPSAIVTKTLMGNLQRFGELDGHQGVTAAAGIVFDA
jgi:hypothetical protein